MQLLDPTDDDIKQLAEQWAFVRQTVERQYGTTLHQSLGDLAAIQRVLDDAIFAADDTWSLQSLGVAFGCVLANNVAGLDWAIVDDEYGRDPTIRYLDTSLVFNVLTMLSSRVEDGETVDVQFLFDELCAQLEELKDQVD